VTVHTQWQTQTCSNRARRTRLRWSTYCRLQIKMKNKINPANNTNKAETC